MPDKTLYEFNGEKLGKGPLVLAVIKHLVLTEGKTFESLKASLEPKGFNDNVIIKNSDYEEKLNTNLDFKNRFFINKPVEDSDGVTFFVWNQWGIGNIDGFVLWARENDLAIKILADADSTLSKYLKFYKNNPAKEWIDGYRSQCEYLESINVDEFDFSSDYFLENYWRSQQNEISSVKPGFLSDEEYLALKAELPKISRGIHSLPTSDEYDDVKSWASIAKKEGKFNTIKHGVINRYFCACSPSNYCTILNHDQLRDFVGHWNKSELGPNIDPGGNWAELNSRVVKAIKLRGFEEEDIYLLNTFIYILKEHLLGEVENAFGKALGANDVKNGNEYNGSSSQPLNTILYGPPGTGKTYSTIKHAVKAVEPDFKNFDDRIALKKRYDTLVQEKRIRFVTFHQSYSYEDFVEGIKAETVNGSISYDVQEGIFREVCSDAKSSGSSKLEAGTESIEEAVIQLKQIVQREDIILKTMTELKFKVVDSSGGGFKIDLLERSENDTGVGIASLKKAFSGDYSKRADVPMPAYTFPILEFMYERGILKRKNSELANVSKVTNNYVLIIDEINRGNISSIFGDLITLIESSKRAGQEEALSVELPYSKESFSVPSNLHIIGTMNTADRSLALMDTALRRRFDFIEMMPDLEVLKDVEVNGIDIPKMLEKMNQRIEVLYDREHTLGHAFFIPLKEAAKDKRFDMLQGIFKNKILPLLEEYFFEDWEKIRLVLGDNQKKDKKLAFISMDKINAIDVLFGSNEEAENLGLDEIITYHRNDSALESEKSYIAIYEH